MVQRYAQMLQHYGDERLADLELLETEPRLYRGVAYGLSKYRDGAACHYYVTRLRGTAAYPAVWYGGTGYLRDQAIRKMHEHIGNLIDAGLCGKTT